MSAPPAGPSAPAVPIPELGPSLGRLTDPAVMEARAPGGLVLDDLRLDFVTRLFELAGAARAAAAHADRAAAVEALSRVGWLGAWNEATRSASARIVELINAGLRSAASESRMPASRLASFTLDEDDARAIAGRLGLGAADLILALEAVDAAGRAARAGDDRGWREWIATVGAAARRVETAWMKLERAAAQEVQEWSSEVDLVRAWRPASWPLWLTTAVLLALATYVGLLLGGYLTVPPPLRGFTDFWWARI